MGGVVEAISDTISSVGDAVGSVVSNVADTAVHVVEVVAAPVAKAVENTVQAAINDPIGTAAKVAAVASGNPQLLPLISGVDAIAHGATPEQVLVSIGTSYVVSQALPDVGPGVTEATGSQIAGAAAQGALQGMTSATLQGRDPLQGAVSGGLNTGLNAGIDVFASDANQALNTPADASILNYQLPSSITGDQVQADQIQTDQAPDMSNIGQMTPADYSLTSATPISNLPSTADASNLGEMSPVDYSLMSDIPVSDSGGLKLDSGATDQGLSMDNIIGGPPSLPSMGGGAGLTLETDQGTLGATGLTPYDSVPVLGDPSSFINNPDVTGTPITTVPSEVYDVNVPNINFASVLNQPQTTAKTPTSTTPTTTGSLSQQPNVGPRFLDVVNPWLTVGTPTIAGGLEEQKLQQLYDNLNPIMAADGGSIDGIHPDLMRVMMSRVGYPDGGSVDSMYGVPLDATQKFIQDQNPKFTKVAAPVFFRPKSQLKGIQLSPLTQLKQVPRLGALAKGGLPSKYAENAPDGHKTEFITGITGYYAGGRGTGQSDDIPAMLHDGDYVIDAEAVSAFGDGSSKAGKDVLTHFLRQVPHKDGAEGNPVPAKIADGEFVLPESFVTSLGGGDNKRGAKMLDEMRQKLREHKRSAPLSKIPPKARSPLDYLKGVKG